MHAPGQGCQGTTDRPECGVTLPDIMQQSCTRRDPVPRSESQGCVHHVDRVPLVFRALQPEQLPTCVPEERSDFRLFARRRRSGKYEPEEATDQMRCLHAELSGGAR